MRPHPHVHVEVAGGPPRGAGRAAAGEPQRRAGVDAGGHVDRVGALLDAAGPRRGSRGTGSRSPARCPPQRGQGGRHHLAEDRLAHPTHLARAAALRAGDRRRAGPSPGSLARRARAPVRTLTACCGAEHGLLELDGRRRPRGRGPVAGRHDPPRAVATLPPKKASNRSPRLPPKPAPPKGSPAPAPPPHASRAEHVVAPAALGVAQRLVRDRDLLERASASGSPGLASGCSSRASWR